MARNAVNNIVVTCTDTLAQAGLFAEDLDRLDRQKGWLKCGYHYVIERDGKVVNTRPIEEPAGHLQSMNNSSILICLVGGQGSKRKWTYNNYSHEQLDSLRGTVIGLSRMFPNAILSGEYELFPEIRRPYFNVREFLKDMSDIIPTCPFCRRPF